MAVGGHSARPCCEGERTACVTEMVVRKCRGRPSLRLVCTQGEKRCSSPLLGCCCCRPKWVRLEPSTVRSRAVCGVQPSLRHTTVEDSEHVPSRRMLLTTMFQVSARALARHSVAIFGDHPAVVVVRKIEVRKRGKRRGKREQRREMSEERRETRKETSVMMSHVKHNL